MQSNQEVIARTNNVLARMGITKAAGGSINLNDVNFGSMIPEPEVRTMINETKSHSQFLSAINQETRQRMKGRIPIYELEGRVMEYVGEQDPTTVSTRPTTSFVEYVTKKHKCDIIFSTEELREMAQSEVSIGDFERNVVDSFMTQLSNNVADVSINGNRSLNANTPTNRMLRGVDGLDVLTDAGANIFNYGGADFEYDKLFDGTLDRMPWKYRRNRQGLNWLYNDRVSTYWRNKIAKIATPLGDQAKTSIEILPPSGIRPVEIPYITEEGGPAAIAPTSAADNTTYIQFVLSTLVTAGDPATAAKGVGRKFKVTCVATGQSEYCTGFLDTTLRINTVGLLGQTTVSTTAGDYTVRPADETDIYLCNPKGITLVWCTEWRTAREYNKDLDQIEIVIYLEFDLVIPIPAAIVKVTNIAIPPIPLM